MFPNKQGILQPYRSMQKLVTLDHDGVERMLLKQEVEERNWAKLIKNLLLKKELMQEEATKNVEPPDHEKTEEMNGYLNW